MGMNETVTAGPASCGSYRYTGPELASEPELTAHARTCDERDHNGRRHCGGSVWCTYCNTFCYGGVVLGACRECRQRWAQFPAVISRDWVARVRQHTGLETVA
jgi:hypothetical protein